MSAPINLLESDPSILENNLKFVKNEFEEEFEQIFGSQPEVPERDCKIVKPIPGMCVKCFKINTNEKFFINLCQTDGIPPPEDISESDLTEILQSDTPSSYRIPMSISEPRNITDKSGNIVDACDIAINPIFFKKCTKAILFRDFLIALILEALSDKYNIQLKADNWIILKNRKCMGTLVTHRVQNRDVKTVYESYKNPSRDEKKILDSLSGGSTEKKLIEEINVTESSALKKKSNAIKTGAAETTGKFKSEQIKEEISLANSTVPQFKIFGKTNSRGEINEVLAEFHLPECLSANEVNLDIGEDRIVLESMKRGYLFDKFLEYKINQERAFANFDLETKMLTVSVPVI